MGKRPMRTCRLAFVVRVEVESDADAPGDDGEGVEWRDVRCYATDDASLVVHRNADDPSVYSLSHAPTGRSIPTEATESSDPLIELANRLSRMTDWAALGPTTGIDELSPGSGGESSGSSTGSTAGSGWGRRRRPGRMMMRRSGRFLIPGVARTKRVT